MLLAAAVMLLMAVGSAPPFQLRNGDFRHIVNGKAADWQPVNHYTVNEHGGREGSAALLLECTGPGDSAGAVQILKFEKPRKGAFVVSAWAKCGNMGDGGDCSLWVDTLQSSGSALWGTQGVPDRKSKRWQLVKAVVRPTEPVTEVRVHLLLRNVRGRARFCNVSMRAAPFEIREFQVFAEDAASYEVRASLSDSVPWRLSARQDGAAIASFTGEGVRAAEQFAAPRSAPVTVTLIAESNGIVKSREALVRPRQAVPVADWWVADSLTRVFQDDLPPQKPAKRVELDAARGEKESFQIALRPAGRPVRDVRISVSDLVCGARKITASNIEWFRVGYVEIEQPFAHPFAQRRDSSWWPDPLLPPVSFHVEKRQALPIWFTVNVPRDAVAGRYSGAVTVVDREGLRMSVPIELTVHRAEIPVQGHMKTAFALMDAYLRRVYGGITPRLRRSYTDYLLAHRLNPDDISRTEPPDLGELEYADSRGLNAFNILNVVEESKDPKQWVCWSPAEAYTPEFKEKFLRRLEGIVPELEKRGLLEKAYVYGFDERGPEYIPIIRDIFGEIKRRFPKIHTLSTCWPPAGTDPLSLNIDWFVPLSSTYDPAVAKEVRKRGGEVWWYVCCGPNYPYANWLIENPLTEARVIWWQAFQQDVEGFLYWGLNIWERKNNERPIAATAGPSIDWSITTGGGWPSLNGDGVLLYPGREGPMGSIRLEAIRDGLEDVELLWQYRDKLGKGKCDRLLSRLTQDRSHFSREPRDLLETRRELLAALD